jgi:hypothetical protein
MTSTVELGVCRRRLPNHELERPSIRWLRVQVPPRKDGGQLGAPPDLPPFLRGELLIDCEEDVGTLRAVLVGMLREDEKRR